MLSRFAPSPTGRMHLGNIFSAMLSWLSAKAQGGEWLLRIEDIDPQRSRQEYADLIMSDLEWLGLTWDKGPYYQSQRYDIYEEYLRRLTERGLVYPCYCTRADILATQAPHESDGRVVYKGTCRPKNSATVPENSFSVPPSHRSRKFIFGLTPSQFSTFNSQFASPAALRLIVPDSVVTFTDGHYGEQAVNLAEHCGDFIVRRKDGAWAYQLAVVIDDALMGITEVVRGCDLLLSSPQQIYLAELLGFQPPHFCHLPLLCNSSGQRLSKRDKSLDMSVLRNNSTPEQILGTLAYHAGITPTPTPMTAKDLIPHFSWNKVPINNITIH
ncbi:MAG: tRNA glutamyl-Q(34) synthetase GluQRS [Prevotella sp.]|nr:tRNA glutamyl-Q(34) synthetase GluQRS [Candidatus Prevotella equi]